MAYWSGRILLYWLLFFAFFRLWFVAWMHKEARGEWPWEAFWHALPLDLSAAAYLTLPAVLLTCAGSIRGKKGYYRAERAFRVLYFLLIVLALIVYGANVFLYEEWQTPINSRAYAHFRIPGAMLSSMSTAFKVGAGALLFILTWMWWRLFRQLVGRMILAPPQRPTSIGGALLLCAGLFLLMRGGFGRLPINESSVCYSSDGFKNDAAINAGWYFVHSLIETNRAVNRYVAGDAEAARQAVADLLPEAPRQEAPVGWLDGSIQRRRPNVVLILLESMTAQVIAELGGAPGVCPNFSRLAQEGILFEHCYGSGYRTDQGLVSVLSGFPALPDHSVVFLPSKAQKLPTLTRSLRQVGYSTAFLYGGELAFANMGWWLRHQGFEHVLSVRDFEAEDVTQLWGVDDGRLFKRGLEELGRLPEPFFAALLTLSLHAPYDVPGQQYRPGSTDREKFLRCAAFADAALGYFFEEAARQPWYANTLFILVADHGHPLPGRVSMKWPRSRHVPLLFFGPPIAPPWRGRCVNVTGNHHDLPATLLRELGLDRRSFRWSRDLFSSVGRSFAYYSNESGLGWVTPAGNGFFDFKTRRWSHASYPPLAEQERLQARAYLQVLYDDFLGL